MKTPRKPSGAGQSGSKRQPAPSLRKPGRGSVDGPEPLNGHSFVEPGAEHLEDNEGETEVQANTVGRHSSKKAWALR